MKDDNTHALSEEELAERRELLKKAKKKGTSELGDGRTKDYSILLLIRGEIARVSIRPNLEYQLGRFEDAENNQIDLSSHGAVKRGVSRLHASLIMDDVHLYIIDHGSTNGTFIEGEQIKPNESIMLHSGIEIILGRLPIQVMFQ